MKAQEEIDKAWGMVRLHPSSKITIRKISTGETKTVPVDLAWYEHSLFFWTEGNFSCDCNRHLVWIGLGNYPDEESKCGHTEYTVIKATFPDGTEQLIDEE